MRAEREPFAELSQKLIGQPYKLGRADCFSIVLQYLRQIGIDFPEEYKGQTIESYPDFFLNDPEAAKEIMISFMEDNFDEIPVGKQFCRDVLLLSLPGSDSLPFLGIHGGNAMVIAASEKYGVGATKLQHYKIERVWRCRKHYQ